jgi:hypothetical protein
MVTPAAAAAEAATMRLTRARGLIAGDDTRHAKTLLR